MSALSSTPLDLAFSATGGSQSAIAAASSWHAPENFAASQSAPFVGAVGSERDMLALGNAVTREIDDAPYLGGNGGHEDEREQRLRRIEASAIARQFDCSDKEPMKPLAPATPAPRPERPRRKGPTKEQIQKHEERRVKERRAFVVNTLVVVFVVLFIGLLWAMLFHSLAGHRKASEHLAAARGNAGRGLVRESALF
jgi:hypothetical protein